MMFRPGDRVRVSARPRPGHQRTPGYVRGRQGRVERLHGLFPNPETRAYGLTGVPKQPVYSVSFLQRELWAGYRGDPGDRVCVDLLESWLQDPG